VFPPLVRRHPGSLLARHCPGWLFLAQARHSGSEARAQSLRALGCRQRAALLSELFSSCRDGKVKELDYPPTRREVAVVLETTHPHGCGGCRQRFTVAANSQRPGFPSASAINRDQEASAGLVDQHLLVVLLVGGLTLLIRRSPGGDKAIGFGRSQPCSGGGHRPACAFRGCGGINEAKEELQEVVTFLRQGAIHAPSAPSPKGVLLEARQVAGNACLAKAIVARPGVLFFLSSFDGGLGVRRRNVRGWWGGQAGARSFQARQGKSPLHHFSLMR